MKDLKPKSETFVITLHKGWELPEVILRENFSGPTFRAGGRPARQTFYQRIRRGTNNAQK